MKAISLWQPWASAIAVGSKRVETRSWSTNYRGRIAIHAAKRMKKGELIDVKCCWNWCGALAPLGVKMGGEENLWDLLPFGAIVAVATLTACRPTAQFTQRELFTPRRPAGETSHLYDWNENLMGDFSLGRFGWVLEDVHQIEPEPYRGEQGLFEIPDEVIVNALARSGGGVVHG